MNDADRAALDFFQHATSATVLSDLTASFARAAEAAGFARGTCYHVATPGQPVAMRYLFGWNLGAWGSHYAQTRLSRYDPAVQAVFTSASAFTWREIEDRTQAKTARQVFDQARAFSALGGLVVPIHGPLGEVMAVTLISDDEREFDARTRMNMQVAATIFASRGLALSETEREASSDQGLSRREIQCVFWINEGKTDWEIGRILGISEDTVAFHLKNVKAKLGVARRSQIPIAAWMRGVLLDERP